MIKYLFQHIKNRRKIELQIIAAAVIVLLLTLVFTPFEIHDWVSHNRIWLMWVLTLLLFFSISVLLSEMYDMRLALNKWQIGEMQEQHEVSDMYKFYDEKGELKLIVKPEMLYYLEAADNYVMIHYLNAGKVEKLMIRNTLKNIEWRFKDKSLVRCHRSYIVNISNVKLLKRSEGDILLDFGNDKVHPLPVSKTYSDIVFKKLAQ